jgi:hypothetical protein
LRIPSLDLYERNEIKNRRQRFTVRPRRVRRSVRDSGFY